MDLQMKPLNTNKKHKQKSNRNQVELRYLKHLLYPKFLFHLESSYLVLK